METISREQAIVWAGERRDAAVAARLLSEKKLAELRRWLDVGPPVENVTKEIAKTQRRITSLIKAITSWVKLAAIWVAGGRARLKVSFSGGRTSGLMARWIKERLSHLFEMVFVFANTGREDDKTLLFVHRCDQAYGLNLVWLECIVNHGERQSSGHRVVSFETASRLEHGDWNPAGWPTPFLEVVKKYGIPNHTWEPCNREMKLRAMDSYMRSIGWDDYYTAIGIRADEPARLDEAAAASQVIHFLANLWPTDKQDVMSYWEDQPFDLDLEEHLGNCVDCHKKSDRKLFMVYAERPEVFEFDSRIESEFAWHGAPHYGTPSDSGKPRNRWRGNRTTKQLIAQAQEVGVRPHIPIKQVRSIAALQLGFDFESGGCSESCEAYPIEVES